MSLATPERIRSLQRKLYCKAKAEPDFRFYTLYDKICRADILAHAYELAREDVSAGAGAAGDDPKAGGRRTPARHCDVGCIMHLVQFGFEDGEARREEFATKSRNL
jgi:hypothetical protein